MKRPLFSIIMPVHNISLQHLSRSLSSVLNQSFTNWELVIAIDGSCPSIEKIAQLVSQQNINLIYLDHKGVSTARNLAISHSTGQYVCFLDGDDMLLPQHLQIFAKEIEHLTHPSIIRTGIFHNIHGKRIKTGLFNAHKWQSKLHFFLSVFYHLSSLCIHRSVFDKYQFNEDLIILEDTEFIARIINHYPLVQINQYTAIVYAHKEQSTHRMYLDRKFATIVESTFESIEGLLRDNHKWLNNQLPANFLRDWKAQKKLEYANGLLLVGRIEDSKVFFNSLNPSFGSITYKILYLKFMLKFYYKKFQQLSIQ